MKAALTASLLMLRRPDDVQVFWVRRAPNARFLADFWAFPGGAVDAADHALAGDDEAGCRVAALRETLEETGFLPGGPQVARSDRERLRRGETTLGALLGGLPTIEALSPAGAIRAPAYLVARFETRYYTVLVDEAADPQVDPVDPELADGEWIRPADALARWQRGEALLAPPTHALLAALAEAGPITPARFADIGACELDHARIRPNITLFPLRTPTLPPATHTNCYVVGTKELLIVEPAAGDRREQARLDAFLDARLAAGARVRGVAITHHHHDHIGGVAHLARRLGVPVLAHPLTAARVPFAVDELIEEGDAITLAGGERLDVIFTPGHAPGHVCFIDAATGTIIVGDMVTRLGSILIDVDDGHVGHYLHSLRRLRALAPSALLPSHGPVIGGPEALIDEYIAHRLDRERQVVQALAAGAASVAALVDRVYVDAPPIMKAGPDGGLAGRALRAHLEQLARDGRATREGDRWALS
ncbi:MAG: MBL fold metallo-hydrolase [Myxococcales bacterium]|nr:MBL fold metallo-hydrolase [Myxococcales bacterium]